MIRIGTTQSNVCQLWALQAYLAVTCQFGSGPLSRCWEGQFVMCGGVTVLHPSLPHIDEIDTHTVVSGLEVCYFVTIIKT